MRKLAIIPMLVVAFLLTAKGAMMLYGVFETTDVYAICESCGLDRAEVTAKIETMRAASETQTRAELVADYFATAGTDTERQAIEACKPCVDAVLNAAGVPVERQPL